MSLLPIKKSKDIHGYDEFFHFGEQKILICIIGYAMMQSIIMMIGCNGLPERDQNAK
jgi:hypothetical protein